LEVTIDRVKIRFYTEGEVREADYTMDQFLSVYRGYGHLRTCYDGSDPTKL
jgi:hypothetical protein